MNKNFKPYASYWGFVSSLDQPQHQVTAPIDVRCPFCWGSQDPSAHIDSRCTGPPTKMPCCQTVFGKQCIINSLKDGTGRCPACRTPIYRLSPIDYLVNILSRNLYAKFATMIALVGILITFNTFFLAMMRYGNSTCLDLTGGFIGQMPLLGLMLVLLQYHCVFWLSAPLSLSAVEELFYPTAQFQQERPPGRLEEITEIYAGLPKVIAVPIMLLGHYLFWRNFLAVNSALSYAFRAC
jgi:hypothetical protein